ncbi:MAG: isoprenylcysteine carboxylmethyltransferase family protein [Hyphomicrobiales bacterium]|nr:isoprenylcysteine carboxylmethyltransferase family protein [Hyphomicrobiales bacterium]
MSEDFKKPFAPPPVIFGVAFLAGLALDVVIPVPLLSTLAQTLIGVVLLAVGCLLIQQSMSAFHKAGTTYNPYAASTELVTSGIYRYTRNPGYLGLAVIQLGLAFLIDGFWIAVMTVVAVVVMDVFVIRLEEVKLGQTFGKPYEDYLGRVRRWI